MTGYLLIATTLVASVIAFRWWVRLLTPWLRRRSNAEDIANASLSDLPGLIGTFLPTGARRVWNVLMISLCVAVLGIPHHLVIWNFFRSGTIDPSYYFHYLWTLAYWLALLGFPALLIARHRLHREGMASAQ
jgi:hypothetical protein